MRLIAELFFAVLWSASLSLVTLFLVTRMLWVGLGVTPADLRDLLRARGLMIRTLLANVVAVPLLAVVLVTVLPLPAEAVVALLLLAAVPGGIDLLSWRATSASSVTGPRALAFVLSIVAIVTSVLMRLLVQGVGMPMLLSPGRLIAVSLLGLLLPLVAGLAIRTSAPAAAATLSRITGFLAVVLFVAASLAIVAIGGSQRHVPGLLAVLALILLAVGAGALGWLIGGAGTPTGSLLAHVTAMRNVGLALMLAAVAMPHAGAALMVVVFAVVLCLLRALVAWPRLTRDRVAVDHPVPSR